MIPGSGRSPGKENGYPLQYSCPWKREWLSTPVFLPAEFQGQRSLVGYNAWSCKQSDITERLTLSLPSALPLLRTLFLLLLYQLHLRPSGIRYWKLGTPVLWHRQTSHFLIDQANFREKKQNGIDFQGQRLRRKGFCLESHACLGWGR